MRILVIAPYTPLLTKPRPYNFILHMAKKHDIVLVCLEDLSQEQLAHHPDYDELISHCLHIERVPLQRARILVNLGKGLLFSRLPLRVNYYGSDFARDIIHDIISKYKIDALYIDRSRFARLVDDIDLPKVLDLTDSISWYLEQCYNMAPFHFKPLYKLEMERMRRYEKTVGLPFNQCLITSTLDKEQFVTTDFYNRINVVPNAVNPCFFTEEIPQYESRNELLFFGNLSYHPNVDGIIHFCRNVFPRIQAEINDVKLHILGNKPAREVQYLEENSSIRVTGWVPSLVEYISSVSVVISPLRIGVGFPNKVAESLAIGKAVVSTYTGCQGLPGAEYALSVAHNDEEFINSTIELLHNTQHRKQLEKQAWAYAREFIHPNDSLTKLDAVYAKL